MPEIAVERLSEEHLPLVEQFMRAQPFHSTEWDRSLNPREHAALARFEIEKMMSYGEGFVAMDGDGVIGVCAIEPLPWECDYFGVSMGRIGIFRAINSLVADVLSSKLCETAGRMGFRHAQFSADSRDRAVILSMQNHGWRVVWANMRMSCRTADIDTSSFQLRMGDFEVVPYVPSHLDALLEISSRLDDYSMLAFEDGLPADRRSDYKIELARNCCETDFADVSFTLLNEGRPVGLNSSKIFTRPLDGLRYTMERVTFIDPNIRGQGAAKFFEMAVMKNLAPLVDYVTGRVRLNASGMFRMLESAGIKSAFGELLLVLEL